jgi:hypothetical protein
MQASDFAEKNCLLPCIARVVPQIGSAGGWLLVRRHDPALLGVLAIPHIMSGAPIPCNEILGLTLRG